MSCREVVREITAYLDGALATRDRERLEAHCGTCPTCGIEIARWRGMIASLGGPEGPHEEMGRPESDRLLALLRQQGRHGPGRPNPDVPLGVLAEQVAPGDHLAYFWESQEEFDAAAGFLTKGAEQGEACVLLGHPEANERLEAAIERAGLDAAGLRREGRLDLIPGRATADALLADVSERILSAVDRGAPLVRILGNLGWGRSGWPADRDLLRLESRVTDMVRKLPVIVMCAYAVGAVAGRNLQMGGVECHPLTLRHGRLRSNDLYVPAAAFLETLDRGEGKE